MRGVWAFICRDARHLSANVISLVVVVGLIVVPSFYAWFNIVGSWDPYGNTKNLKVAVANSDEDYTSELMPVSINVGERTVFDLQSSDSIDYVITDEDDAIEGVRSGTYYAAIVIPPNFSADMMTILSSTPAHPQVFFYQNEKANAIAQIVTGKASSAVKNDIDASFARSVTSVGIDVFDEIGTYLDDTQVSELASKLDLAVDNSHATLTSTASNIRSYSELLTTTKGLLDSGSGTFDASLSSALDAGASLRDSADGIRDLGEAADDASGSVSKSLGSSAASLDSVSSAINDAYDEAAGQSDKLSDALTTTNDDVVEPLIAQLSTLCDDLDATDALFAEYETNASASQATKDAIHQARLSIQTLRRRVAQARSNMQELSAQLDETVEKLQQDSSNTGTTRAELEQLVSQAKAEIFGAQADYDNAARSSLQDLVTTIESAADDAQDVTMSLSATLGTVNSTTSSAAGSLGEAHDSLDSAATTLDVAANKLADLHANLHAALEAGDLTRVRSLLTSGPDALAAFIASPVSVERTALFSVENNGSAMTPFYTVLAIWIGDVMLCALVKAIPSEASLQETGCSHGQSYLGRLALFVAISLLQATLICAGDLFFLQVQCAHPALFFLAGWVASLAFVNIVYALTASFADVGKALAVVLMVVQVAGSGGTFPKEMLPQAFQAAYPFLPFVHAENAMRAALFGLYGTDFWVELAILLAFLIPSLLLGLVLRRPVINLNEWVEHKLESTRVM